MKIIIRKAVEADYEPLCRLWDEVDLLHRQRLPAFFRRPEGAVREWEYFTGLLADEEVGIFVAEIAGELLGFVHALAVQTREIPVLVPRRYAAIDNLVVTEHARRQGIGRFLMKAAEDWARERGLATVELTVYEFNQGAIKLYEKLGYETLFRRMSKSLS